MIQYEAVEGVELDPALTLLNPLMDLWQNASASFFK
jgi:hypothetical protein